MSHSQDRAAARGLSFSGFQLARRRRRSSMPTFRAKTPLISKREAQTVRVDLLSVEVEGRLADRTTFGYWTFNGKVPGPLYRRHSSEDDIYQRNDSFGSRLPCDDRPGGGLRRFQVRMLVYIALFLITTHPPKKTGDRDRIDQFRSPVVLATSFRIKRPSSVQCRCPS
jgi:hypothetical protein